MPLTAVVTQSAYYTNVNTTPRKRFDETSEQMLASIELSVIYPVAILKVNVIRCRILLDTGSGS